jgi:hypothetical protein
MRRGEVAYTRRLYLGRFSSPRSSHPLKNSTFREKINSPSPIITIILLAPVVPGIRRFPGGSIP